MVLDTGTDLHAVIRAPELATAFSRAVAERLPTVAEVRIGVPVERRLTARVVPMPGIETTTGLILVSFRDRTSEAQLDQMRSDFVANASHEPRTPLASLKGFIETLQGTAKDSRERGGTGLGLAIVKHIVNRHRGRMDIASVLGKGTTLTVSPTQEVGQ